MTDDIIKNSNSETNKKSQDENSVSSSSHCKNGFFSMFSSIPNGIFAVSFFGLFLGMSTTMVYSQFGLFLKNEMGISAAMVSTIDGFVEFLSYIIRVFSGILSDFFKERKLILFIGCFVTLIARPLLTIAHSSFMIIVVQSIERLGNGLQASPRDALIADLSVVADRGKSFGFSRSLKTIGSLIGTPIAIFIMWYTKDSYRTVFLLATIPVIISILCLTLVKNSTRNNSKKEKIEIATKEIKQKRENPFKKRYLKSLDASFWRILILAFIFELAHFSENLFPIYANIFINTTFAGFASMFVSLGQALCSFPIGYYADKIGKARFIKICMVMMVSSNLFFLAAPYTANPYYLIYLGAFLWGGQMTAIQGLFLSLISEQVNFHLRATAIGIYFCMLGTGYLIASVVGGGIWTTFGPNYAFMYSIFFSCIALISFKFLLPKKYLNAQ